MRVHGLKVNAVHRYKLVVELYALLLSPSPPGKVHYFDTIYLGIIWSS